MKTAEDLVLEAGRDMVSVSANTSVREAVQVMVENKSGAVLVEKEGRIAGLWTERDLLRNLITPGFDAETAMIGDYMLVGIRSAPHTASEYKLMDRFLAQNLRHLLIEKNGRNIGLLSVEDVNRTSLLEKTKDYNRLFESMGCGVFVSSREGRFEEVNQALVNMLGYETKSEFYKLDIAKDLYLRKGDRKKFQETVEKKGRVVDYEVDFKDKYGDPISVLLTCHVRRNKKGEVIGYEGINVDQSHRKRMEDDLRKAHDFTNKVIQSSPNAIIATDMKGCIIIWNRAAEEALGYRAEDVVGKMSIHKIYPENMARKVMMMMRSPEYGGKGRLRAYPMVYVREDGTNVEVNLSAGIVYDQGGREVASVGNFVDLTETIRMEQKLSLTREQLLQSEKLAAMGRLTSQIAHELNNPLFGIMNTLELMKTEITKDNRRRKILDMAYSETERLSQMLKKMLSFSKPDQEKKRLVDLNVVLDEILLLHGKQLQENSVKIKTVFKEDLPMVHASRDQLRQVFLNMVSNARDAMPEGGTLCVSTRLENEHVTVTLADTGAGIKEEHLGKIFETFFTTKGSVKGVGLGLSVCYGFIKEHGGDINVESTVGEGTNFHISLPLPSEAAAS